jgi:hypothetical protein
MKMKTFHVAITLFVLCLYAMAQHAPATDPHAASNAMEAHNHDHSNEPSGAAVSYSELKETAEQLERARQATAKYRDPQAAKADGYMEAGDEVKGMGVHFIREVEPDTFHLEKPPILVYEKKASAPGGFSLVGVAYLLQEAEGPDGQPVNSPFPKPLAVWHKHKNVCVLPDPDHKLNHTTKLTEEQCQQQGGHYSKEWMIHAWIWKDSPRGVFSPRNPVVATTATRTEE